MLKRIDLQLGFRTDPEFLYFLTRAIADAGIKNKCIGVVWLMPLVKLLFAAKCIAIAFIH